jgi:phage replication initiation protein
VDQFTGIATGWQEAGVSAACEGAPGCPQGAPEATAAPPLSNTGALSTSCLIDWVAVTFSELRLTVEEVCDLFGGRQGWVTLPHGFKGYRCALQRPGVTVLSEGRPGMGVHVQLTGDGCRQLEAEGFVEDWVLWLHTVVACGGQFARLDVAIDDRSGLLDLEEVAKAPWVGRTDKRRVVRGTDQNGDVAEHTITFGSRVSETYLRIYDKALEQGQEGHWVRCELELKRERAQALAEEIAAGGMEGVVAGVLRAHISFVTPSATDTNRSRWAVCQWWLDFLAHAEKLHLSTGKPTRTVTEAFEWVRRQVGPMLGALWVHQGCDWEWLHQVVQNGVERLRPHHKVLALSPYFDAALRPLAADGKLAALQGVG